MKLIQSFWREFAQKRNCVSLLLMKCTLTELFRSFAETTMKENQQ
ncbi:hypothetical protein VCEM1626_003814 [Vibrio cholerae O1 str. EM-1626]|nr:hypothetical protein VCEM1626_003814 [Vibrio cholerae O1 str. EM-1626]